MTTPWEDFFKVYVELAQAIRGELTDANRCQQMDNFIAKLQGGTSQDEWHKHIVHEVIARFRGKSKDILHQNYEYFNEPLLLFPEIDTVDIAELWRSHPMYRNGIWAWIEQIYIIGNVCLHPNRKDKFLQIVRQIKATKPGSTIAPIAAANEEEPEDVQEVVKGIANMMGIDGNSAMMEMMGEVAQHMQKTMTSSSNPMELIQAMMNGDTTPLGDLQERMQAKMAQKIQSGEISEADLERQREGMLQKFGGMDGMLQMASGLGLDVGPLSAAVNAPVAAKGPAKAPAKAPAKKSAPPKK
jgi:hypothetical protein